MRRALCWLGLHRRDIVTHVDGTFRPYRGMLFVYQCAGCLSLWRRIPPRRFRRSEWERIPPTTYGGN